MPIHIIIKLLTTSAQKKILQVKMSEDNDIPDTKDQIVCDLIYMRQSRIRKPIKTDSRLVVARGGGKEGVRSNCSTGVGISVWGMKKFLKQIVVMTVL